MPARRWCGLFALVLLAIAAPERAAAQTQEEARAIFLYNFAKFVEWPESAFAAPTTPVTIAIVGDRGVAEALERYVKGRNANGRDIVVRDLDSPEGCEGSHIVFVGAERHAAAVIELVRGKPILTVGQEEAFLKAGGTIRLFARGPKVLCAINLKAADAAGLKLGDKLVKASS